MAGRKTVTVKDGETINSVVRRVRSAMESTVVILSEGADDLFLNEVNLRLIQYYAQEDDKNVVVESENPEVRRMCQELGLAGSRSETPLPVKHESAAGLEQAPVQAPTAPTTVGRRPALRLWWLLPFFFMIVAIVWFTFVANPSVVVVVHPSVRPMTTDITLQASMGLKRPDPAKMVIPSTPIDRQGEVQFTMPTTGRAVVGDQTARGLIVLINDTAAPVTVPRGTTVATQSGVKFATTKDVTVPRRTVEFFAGVPAGLKAGQCEVPIEAIEKGSQGNVAARRVQAIQGPLAGTLRVVNPEPTREGSDRQIHVVSAGDLAQAEKEARSQALVAAVSDLTGMVGADRLLFEELVQAEVQSVEPLQKAGVEASELTIHVSYRARSFTVERETLAKVIAGHLAGSLPKTFALASDSVHVRSVTATPRGLRDAVLHATVDCRVFGVVDRTRVIRGLLGKKSAEAHRFLGATDEIGEYSIRPSNAAIPKWRMRLKVIVVEPS